MSNDLTPEQKAMAALNTARDELIELDANEVLIKMLDEVIDYAQELADEEHDYPIDYEGDDDDD